MHVNHTRTAPTTNNINNKVKGLELEEWYSRVLGGFYDVDQVLARGGHFHVCGVSIYLDLARFGGHGRHILPPLSPSQPAIAYEETICWGTFLNFFCFLCFS